MPNRVHTKQNRKGHFSLVCSEKSRFLVSRSERVCACVCAWLLCVCACVCAWLRVCGGILRPKNCHFPEFYSIKPRNALTMILGVPGRAWGCLGVPLFPRVHTHTGVAVCFSDPGTTVEQLWNGSGTTVEQMWNEWGTFAGGGPWGAPYIKDTILTGNEERRTWDERRGTWNVFRDLNTPRAVGQAIFLLLSI